MVYVEFILDVWTVLDVQKNRLSKELATWIFIVQVCFYKEHRFYEGLRYRRLGHM